MLSYLLLCFMTCCATVFVQFFQRIIILLEENYEIKKFDFSTQKKLVILLYPLNLKIYQLMKELKGLEDFLIPEQFTVKAHPALMRGRGGVSQKMRHCYSTLQLTYTFKTRTKHKNTAKARSLCVYRSETLFMQSTIVFVSYYGYLGHGPNDESSVGPFGLKKSLVMRTGCEFES